MAQLYSELRSCGALIGTGRCCNHKQLSEKTFNQSAITSTAGCLWTRERRCASPAAATAAAWGGAGLLQPHRAGPPERRPRGEVRAIDHQQQPSCWLCRRRISRAAPSCRATCGSSGRGGPLDEPPRRSESSPQARCCGAGSWHATGKGRGTPPERPEGCCSCWAGRNRCGFRASRPRVQPGLSDLFRKPP